MYTSFLSALLIGLVPMASVPIIQQPPALAIEIAPPSHKIDIAEHLSASGVLVIDMTSGQQIFGNQQEVQRPMASLTKLMTAILIVEHHDLNEWMTIPKGVASAQGNKAYLEEGEQFTVGDVLSALLISSANDAAQALAIYHAGSESAFVAEMNHRAGEMGLKDTLYANASGLDHPRQWSTPRDIARLAMMAMGNSDISKRMSKRGTRIYSQAGEEYLLAHTHALMHVDTAVLAGKTGTTVAAGQCLVTLVQEGGREYLVVLQRSLQRYADMRVILDVLNDSVV